MNAMSVFPISGLLILSVSLAAAYDPKAIVAPAEPDPIDLTVADSARSREIPIRVYLPASKSAAPVVLFSVTVTSAVAGLALAGTSCALVSCML